MKLRKMNAEDWFGFQGAEHFEDGSEPMINYLGNEKVVLLDKNGLCYGIGDSKWYQLECTRQLGIIISELLQENTSEEFLIELGFEDIM